VFTHPVSRRHDGERAWTAHLATELGVRELLEALRRAPLPEHLLESVDELLRLANPCAVHQLHLDGRYPDLAVRDPRDRLFAVVEAQRGRADDRHIAKLAAHYVPRSGARLGVLVTEGWDRSWARHPAWAECPAPVVVLVARDTLHRIDYEVAWVHHPPVVDGLEAP
jgi:hypothetical protein